MTAMKMSFIVFLIAAVPSALLAFLPREFMEAVLLSAGIVGPTVLGWMYKEYFDHE